MIRSAITVVVALTVTLVLATVLGRPAFAQPAKGLDAFLEQVHQRAKIEEQINQQREQEFRADLDAARAKIQEARVAVTSEQARQERLLAQYDANEAELAELEAVLREEQGGLGEMFGVVRQSAGDFHAQFMGSLAMADKTEALEFLGELSNSRALPGMAELERMWLAILEEMVGSSRVERFSGEVVLPDGTKQGKIILRACPFNALADGLYLSHVQGRKQFLELPRQPQGRHLRLVRDLEQAQGRARRASSPRTPPGARSWPTWSSPRPWSNGSSRALGDRLDHHRPGPVRSGSLPGPLRGVDHGIQTRPSPAAL